MKICTIRLCLQETHFLWELCFGLRPNHILIRCSGISYLDYWNSIFNLSIFYKIYNNCHLSCNNIILDNLLYILTGTNVLTNWNNRILPWKPFWPSVDGIWDPLLSPEWWPPTQAGGNLPPHLYNFCRNTASTVWT